MKLYANEIAEKEIMDAALQAGASVEKLIVNRGRRYARSFDVILSGSGARRSQWRDQEVQAATWDEWGIFMARLFDHEPEMRIGPYRDRDHFRWSTGERYDDLEPAEQHKIHRWRYSWHDYHMQVQECDHCEAVRRFELRRSA
jgi:hypothetical protein